MRHGMKDVQAIQTVLTGLNTDWQEKLSEETGRDRDSHEAMLFGQARCLAKTLGR